MHKVEKIMFRSNVFVREISERGGRRNGDDQDRKILLTESQLSEFNKALKIGIYKELYERDLLTGSQLTWLLNRIGSGFSKFPSGSEKG